MVKIEGTHADRLADAADGGALCTAETAECGCPDRCDRDHSNE
ncbi:MAG: hypothetical protein ABI401_00535 [Candidatus Dormibacter sp.]